MGSAEHSGENALPTERGVTGFDGPWQRDNGGIWCLGIRAADGGIDIYEVEYRRVEGDAHSGYYLFGPRRTPPLPFGAPLTFDGLLLTSGSARMARYEAFARVMAATAVPNPYEHISGHDWLRGRHLDGRPV